MTVGVASHTDESVLCTVHWRTSGLGPALPALSQVFSRLDCPSILGGNQAKADADRFSYWAAEPREVFEFHAGEGIHTENSYKYTLDGFGELAARAGFLQETVWMDDRELFSVQLLEVA